MKTAMVAAILMFLLLTVLTGCESIETIHQHRVSYCSKTADSITKKVAIKAIRYKVPGYPEKGICIGITGEV